MNQKQHLWNTVRRTLTRSEQWHLAHELLAQAIVEDYQEGDRDLVRFGALSEIRTPEQCLLSWLAYDEECEGEQKREHIRAAAIRLGYLIPQDPHMPRAYGE